MRQGGLVLALVLGMAGIAYAATQTGNDQCRGLTDPGTHVFATPFSSTPRVTCTAATYPFMGGEHCFVLSASATQFTFECKTAGGVHIAGPMTWSASN